MRRLFTAAVSAIAVLALTGCSLYNAEIGNDISQFVKPDSSSVIDSLPTDSELRDLDAYVDSIDTDSEGTMGDTEQTEQDVLMATAGVEEGSFVIEDPELDADGNLLCNGFKFYVPALWRNRMVAEVITENLHDYMVTTYNFYYVQQDNGAWALEMSIKVAPTRYYQTYGVTGATRLVTDNGRGLEYFLMASTEALPDNFTDFNGYSEVYSNLANQDDTITVIESN